MYTYCKQLKSVITREECTSCGECTPTWHDALLDAMWDGLDDLIKGS